MYNDVGTWSSVLIREVWVSFKQGSTVYILESGSFIAVFLMCFVHPIIYT